MKILWPLLACFVVLLTGCERNNLSTPARMVAPPPPGFPSEVKDGRGKNIRMARPPKRIVVAGTPLYSEVLMDLGADYLIVGIASSPGNPLRLKKLEKIGKVWPLNIEKVVALQPDLILGTMGIFRTKLEQLGKAPVFTGGTKTGQIRSTKDIASLVERIDKLVHGKTERYKQWWSALQKRRQHLLKPLQTLRKKPRISAAIVYLSSPQASTMYLTGKGSPAHELLLEAHGRNVFTNARTAASSIEALVKADPDVIITAPSYIKRFQKHKVLKQLRAVQKGRILGISPSMYTSTRFLKALRAIIKGLHPSLKLPSSRIIHPDAK